jgi:hypothetical protein
VVLKVPIPVWRLHRRPEADLAGGELVELPRRGHCPPGAERRRFSVVTRGLVTFCNSN